MRGYPMNIDTNKRISVGELGIFKEEGGGGVRGREREREVNRMN